ncbi:MAG: 1-acyl-sn-glycerol-3-phosphate acyltransferase [Spirochaetaceae bacterium]|nr:1-acyl-sn-glycerol-3-phosphate acyltransferase [Spirochaetaceae bacterium]
MIHARRYTPTIQPALIWLIRQTYGRWLQKAYNTSAQGLELFKRIKPPFILVGNHSTILDPFIANTYIPHNVNWIASDGNMRNKVMRFIMIKLAGCIPKSKAIPDIETVSWIFEIIKKKKGVVGIYPEGYSSWNGSSVKSFGSTAKLLKTLKVPVVCILTKGAYMTKPRWAHTRRRGKVEMGFTELFAPETLKTMKVDEIDARLNEALYHEDPAWVMQKGYVYEHRRLAEYLELVLYACPSCGSLQSLHSEKRLIKCRECGFIAEYKADGSFAIADRGIMPHPLYEEPGKEPCGTGNFFPSIKEWDLWQEAHLAKLLDTVYCQDPGKAIFGDDNVQLLKGKRMDTMKKLGRGSIMLTYEGLIFKPRRDEKPRRAGNIQFPIEDIDAPGVLKWNHFEFYEGNTVYRIKFANRDASGKKYATAVDLLLKAHAPKT